MTPAQLFTLGRTRSVLLTLFCALIYTGSFAIAYGQGGVGSTRGLPSASGGTNIIQGRVYFPVEPKGGRRVKVRLSSTDLVDQSTVTDEDGSFVFNRLPAGHYTVVVDAGSEFDTASETVNIDREASVGGRNRQVIIQLKEKGAAAALAAVPKAARESYTKGMEAAAKGENKKAAELLAEAVKVHPQFQQALTELGLQYLKLNEMESAADTYRALIKLKKDNASAHLNLGIALYNVSLGLLNEKKNDEATQKLTEAEQSLRQAIALKMPGPNPHYYLGLTLIRFKKYNDAQAEMELTIANGGENIPLAHKYLGGLYMSAKRHKEAADHLEKYLQLDPKAKDAEQINNTIKDLRAKQ
ncbi:MAG TPA: tetratricopeptide repeat protein [Pyrinomonadaceae bacterium]|nr:tetratricopeptide repeat protein [Pyrinomonadaceae bacterium]